MVEQGAGDEEVERTLSLLREFEAKCLRGEPATPEYCKQVCLLLLRQWCHGRLVGASDY
jgi:hypothetical protein